MAVQTVKLAGKKFVIVPEKDYRNLERRANGVAPPRRQRKLTAQDRADLAEALRRLADPDDKPIPWERARKELGIG